jgi:hypothetical protein
MKSTIRKARLILVILIVFTLDFCQKEEVLLPVLTTSEVTEINFTSATSGGTITSEGSGTVRSRGVCWSTNDDPTIADNKTSDGVGPGNFTSIMLGLNGSTTYFVRAYATNSGGTGYGMTISFKTSTCKTCQQNTYDSGGNLLTAGSETEYCGATLIQIEATQPVTVLGVTTKWVCR